MTYGLSNLQLTTATPNDKFEHIADVQAVVFMTEIIPALWGCYPLGTHKLRILDVGSRTGAGADLLRVLHHPVSFSRIKIELECLDVNQNYRDIAIQRYPDLNYSIGDIYDCTSTYDVIICSHCIEHVPNPSDFLLKLRSIARDYVIIATPFHEEQLISGHVNRFDYKFFENTECNSIKVYKSLTWHNSYACIGVYDGLAE